MQLGYFYHADVVMVVLWVQIFMFLHFSLHGRWPAWSMPSSFHFLFLTKANAGIVSVFLLYVFFAFNVVYQKNLSLRSGLLLGAGHLGSLLLLCGC
jgi:hypothetical protein